MGNNNDSVTLREVTNISAINIYTSGREGHTKDKTG